MAKLNISIVFRCPTEYVGEYCEYSNPCQTGGQKCQNGGTCVVRDTGNGNKPTFQCVCPIGYSHSFCEVAVSDNACLNSPCNNGGTCTLVSNISNYTCSCPVGWKGKAHFLLLFPGAD